MSPIFEHAKNWPVSGPQFFARSCGSNPPSWAGENQIDRHVLMFFRSCSNPNPNSSKFFSLHLYTLQVPWRSIVLLCFTHSWSGWWCQTLFIPYIGNNHPNWLSYVSRWLKHVKTTFTHNWCMFRQSYGHLEGLHGSIPFHRARSPGIHRPALWCGRPGAAGGLLRAPGVALEHGHVWKPQG